MANYRNDPSSISFGRRVQQLEQLTATQANRIQELESNGLSPDAVQAGKEIAAERRAERKRANGMLADFNASLEDYQSLNQSLLTTSQKEQLRHNMNALHAAQTQPAIQFTDDAVRRIQNWRDFSRTNGVQAFAENNSQPMGQARRPYDVWLERQNSPAGRMHNARSQRNEVERLKAQAQSKVKPKRSAGRTIGKQKPTEK